MASSDQANRNVAVYFIVKGARQGASGASILRALRANNLGYRTETFYNDYNYYLSHAARLPTLTNAQREWFIPVSGVISFPSRSQTFFKYNFNVFATNRQTGVGGYRELSITSDQRLAPYEAFQTLANGLEQKYSYLGVDRDISSFVGTQYFSPQSL